MKALVIIDMQDAFVTKESDLSVNRASMEALASEQVQMIEIAKRKSLPILLVRYDGYGEINEQILDAVGANPKSATVTKTVDGLFDDAAAAAQAMLKFREWNVTDLIIMGANGGYCVEATIRGALTAGYKVWSFKNGIIDFNTHPFKYPYSYLPSPTDYNIRQFSPSPSFLEFNQPIQTVNFRRMPRSGS